MIPDRPIDTFVKRSQNILQKEYVVIGKRHISGFTAWAMIAFFIGIAIAVAFLASRSGTLEGSEAARTPRPVWSSWSKAQEGNCEGKTSDTQQCRSVNVRNTVIEGGKRKRVTAAGFQTRSCQKNCETLAGAQFQQQGQQNQFAGSTGCTAYNLGGETPSLPVIQAFNNHLFIALRGNAAAGYQTFVNEWDPVTKTPVIPDIPGKAGGGWLWVGGGATSDTPQLNIEGTKLAMYVKGWAGGPLDAAFRTEYTGIYPDYWIPWSPTGQGAGTVIPGPFTTTFQGATYNVKKDPNNSVILEECQGAAGSDTVTVSKTYLEVSPADADTQVQLDSGSFMPGNPAVFTNVSAGNHTLIIEVPANTKAFYVGGEAVGPTIVTKTFFHTIGKNDSIRIIYAPPSAVSKTRKTHAYLGECAVSDGWADPRIDETKSVRVPLVAIWDGADNTQEHCSKEVYIADFPGDEGERDGIDDLYALVSRAVADWDRLTTIELKLATDGDIPGTATFIPDVAQTINGIAAYDTIALKDRMNLIGYADKDFDSCTNPVTQELKKSVAETSIHEIRTSSAVYITEFDIEINPNVTFTAESLERVLFHEFGHGLGLDHNSEGPPRPEVSVMSYGRGRVGITGFDAAAINNNYKCNNSPPQKASIALEITNQPTPLISGICRNYPPDNHWRLNAVIRETSKTLGVTLQDYVVEYYDQTKKLIFTTLPSPFTNLTSGKGFSSPNLLAGDVMGATLCQIPWKPEQLLGIRLKIRGVDERGNEVEAWDKIKFTPQP